MTRYHMDPPQVKGLNSFHSTRIPSPPGCDLVTLLEEVRDILCQGREDGDVVEGGDAAAPATVGRLAALVNE